jgi:chorismate--pyruvate lyase
MLADASARAWLLDDGALTARIKARCRDFHVQVLRQGRVRVTREERALLGIHGSARAIGRDVLLKCGPVPVVFAHSVMRAGDLRGAWRSIAAMGARPLGAALFADPRIERCPLTFRRLDRGHPLYCAAASAVGRVLPPLWARRSLFLLRGAPLLVTEAYLPDIAGLPSMGTAQS